MKTINFDHFSKLKHSNDFYIYIYNDIIFSSHSIIIYLLEQYLNNIKYIQNL